MSEIQTLRRRWLKADNGNPMPEDIASQPIELIRKAVSWREKGITVVVVPPMFAKSVASEISDTDSSLSEWDGHNNLS